MSSYTEADVERDFEAALTAVSPMTDPRGDYRRLDESRRAAPDCIARLRDAALEGAKVPGLMEHSRNQERRCEDLARQCREAESQASTLQARVEELEQENRDLRASGSTEQQMREFAESERDALRAQVEAVRARVERMMSHEVNADVRADLLAVLSAPPAETTGRCCVKARAVVCTSCAQHWVCAVHGEQHAVTAPAPERAEVKRASHCPYPDRECPVGAVCDECFGSTP